MKKLIVLAIAMMLVSLGAFAQVTITGEVEYQVGTDFEDGFADTSVVELNFTAAVDDYDTVHIDLEPDGGARDQPAPTGAGILEEAWFVSDIGGRFMLPETVSLMVYYGFEEWESAGVGQVTLSEMEYGVLDWNPQGWGTKASIGIMDMVTIDIAWLFSGSDESGFGSSNNSYDGLIDVHGAIDAVEFQVAYANEAYSDFGTGLIGVAAGYTDEVADGIALDSGAKFSFDIDAPTGAPEWYYSLAAGVTYMDMVGLNLAFRGYDGAEAEAMGIEVWTTPIELVRLQVVTQLGLDDAVWPETFDSLEALVEFNVGQVDWYFGYLFVSEGGGIDKDYAEVFPAAMDPADLTREGEFFFGGELQF